MQKSFYRYIEVCKAGNQEHGIELEFFRLLRKVCNIHSLKAQGDNPVSDGRHTQVPAGRNMLCYCLHNAKNEICHKRR